MIVKALRVVQHVCHQQGRFCFLNLEVLLIQLFWREIMRNYFPFLAPEIIHLMQCYHVALSQQVTNISVWSIRVDVAPLVQKLMNGFAITQNNHVSRAEFE
jgi:hypothetical protein